MVYKAINFNEKLSSFNVCWEPKNIGKLDNYLVKVVKIKGHFSWHCHKDCDELFIVNKGEMRIDFRDGEVQVRQGEMFIVPKGIEHKPFSEDICEIILIERNDVVNTGDVQNEFTHSQIEWI